MISLYGRIFYRVRSGLERKNRVVLVKACCSSFDSLCLFVLNSHTCNPSLNQRPHSLPLSRTFPGSSQVDSSANPDAVKLARTLEKIQGEVSRLDGYMKASAPFLRVHRNIS